MKKINRIFGQSRLAVRLPATAHVLELVIGITVFAAGQNLWAVLVSANPDILPPSVPANLRVASRSATDVEMTWDAATDDVAVTSYQLFRDGTAVYTGSATDFDDTGRAPNTAYSYTVLASDAASNNSAQSSAVATATLADTSPPSVPSNVRQTSQTISSISVAWNPSADNVGVASYNVYRNGQLVKNLAGTSFTDTGLAVFTGYTYHVTAIDAAGNGTVLSAPLYGSTAQDVTPPSVPDNLHQTSQTITSVTLSWDAATDDVSVTGYRVYRDGNLVGSPNGTSFTDSGLGVNSNYTYTVLAHDASGNDSAQSSPLTGNSAPDTTAPTSPTNIHLTDTKDTSLALSWDASSDDVAVVGYKLYRDGTLIASPTTTSFTDTVLTPVTEYAYTIKAVDAAGNVSNTSATFRGTTAYDTTNPSVPANLTSTGQTDTTITLSWDAATDNVGVSGYDLYRGSTLITTTLSTSFTDSGLSVATSYTYKVRAHDASSNNSAQSAPYTIATLPDAVAPSVPTGLALSVITNGSITLDWDAATDDVAVTKYRLYRDGVAIYTGTSLHYVDTGLHYGQRYHYQVSALDFANNESGLSPIAFADTLPDTVAPVVSLTAPAQGDDIKFTVPISATASDDLDLAKVEIYINSYMISSMTTAPFTVNWDSYGVANGTQTITAKAYDASGNTSSQAITITVSNPPPPVYGDLNGDYKVNIYDLSILLAHWGKSGAGDYNNNGKVDIFDLSVLLARFGKQ
ncbi:MAG: fibronectin type domain protein [Candidatus Saccharibacteria bacterium]|nr:fibronectin type domain protein [Candidatus Saccharibacteria bacterium]